MCLIKTDESRSSIRRRRLGVVEGAMEEHSWLKKVRNVSSNMLSSWLNSVGLGVFEQVMTHEVAKIKAMKDAEGKRKTVSLRGGAVIPKKEAKDDKCTFIDNN